jgi:hypothetical protein
MSPAPPGLLRTVKSRSLVARAIWKAKLHSLAAFQDPIGSVAGKQAYEEAIECDLTTQALEIDGLVAGDLLEALLECRAERWA